MMRIFAAAAAAAAMASNTDSYPRWNTNSGGWLSLIREPNGRAMYIPPTGRRGWMRDRRESRRARNIAKRQRCGGRAS